ncbi:sigma factor-like helix-turn-helix DNA-binding protein [Kibdelosporangium aridum]|uniref:RNA polymerase sigma-70 factor, ECF subfamily n=1 Tax=Kibdelosporangium aridum TaxID=2030 RepID=A0A1Y5Y5P1_KIBAR|nr:sigma factor-like helix-turn-helix DNA-binding protein [Kibdelosporangium aridum]SMD24512.1 RNA polymerase sigma-70 factor, ECF subfamily [Kibdelosporangium aridum]
MGLGDIVVSTIKPVVVRYCRARIGRRDGSFAVADLVAKETLHAVLRSLTAEREPLLAITYRMAVKNVTRELKGEPGCADSALNVSVLPDGEREILILRAMCGLTAEQTAEAIGSTPADVRIAQHRALEKLRKSSQLDGRVTRFGHGATMETLSERC